MEVEIVIQGRIGIAKARMGIKGKKGNPWADRKNQVGMDLVAQGRIEITRM